MLFFVWCLWVMNCSSWRTSFINYRDKSTRESCFCVCRRAMARKIRTAKTTTMRSRQCCARRAITSPWSRTCAWAAAATALARRESSSHAYSVDSATIHTVWTSRCGFFLIAFALWHLSHKNLTLLLCGRYWRWCCTDAGDTITVELYCFCEH